MEKLSLGFTPLRKIMSDVFNAIPEWRQPSKVDFSIHDALMSGVACMYFQDPSLLQFQEHLKDQEHRSNLETLFDVKDIPKNSQMREIVDQVDSKHFSAIFRGIINLLEQNGQLAQFQLFPGLHFVPMDGTTYYTSKKIHCKRCLQKRNRTKFCLV